MKKILGVGERLSYKLKQDLTTHAGELVVARFDFSQVKLLGKDFSPTQDTLPISFGFSSQELFATDADQQESRTIMRIQQKKREAQEKLEAKIEEQPKEYIYSELLIGRLNPSGYVVHKYDLDPVCIEPFVEPNAIYYEKRLLFEGTEQEVAAKTFLDRSVGKLVVQGFGAFKMLSIPETEINKVERLRAGYRFYKTDIHYDDDFFGWTHCQPKILDIVVGNESSLQYLADVTRKHVVLDLPLTTSVERIYDRIQFDPALDSDTEDEGYQE